MERQRNSPPQKHYYNDIGYDYIPDDGLDRRFGSVLPIATQRRSLPHQTEATQHIFPLQQSTPNSQHHPLNQPIVTQASMEEECTTEFDEELSFLVDRVAMEEVKETFMPYIY
eukprot:TRINITY_DN4682_c0_g1_i1.p1 TRINITY_DN4682_c0_g1~~TRINITY_DN4682_c0_g1_i1.p1  ORF type:complete len:113 (-),score=21.86 TRINITY_DN4682_c0_g1_i1:88-426(-)